MRKGLETGKKVPSCVAAYDAVSLALLISARLCAAPCISARLYASLIMSPDVLYVHLT